MNLLLLLAVFLVISTVSSAGSSSSISSSGDINNSCISSTTIIANASSRGGGAYATYISISSIDDLRLTLLDSYVVFLKAQDHFYMQSNGLKGGGGAVNNVCELWDFLQPSAKDVFITITGRLDGSKLAGDGSSALSHIKSLYRLAGGEGASATSTGSCGGGEFNRMIMSMDVTLHDALVTASDRKGSKNSNGLYDISDVVASSFWRDSHDYGGPHAPFTLSDETDGGAPRGQTHYFRDISSVAANSALNRMDLLTLVDPLALEMDQDYDCTHNSNPQCEYTWYGWLCAPQTRKSGMDIYAENYGHVDTNWRPSGC